MAVLNPTKVWFESNAAQVQICCTIRWFSYIKILLPVLPDPNYCVILYCLKSHRVIHGEGLQKYKYNFLVQGEVMKDTTK
jgi:hypothetical protein